MRFKRPDPRPRFRVHFTEIEWASGRSEPKSHISDWITSSRAQIAVAMAVSRVCLSDGLVGCVTHVENEQGQMFLFHPYIKGNGDRWGTLTLEPTCATS